MRKKLPPSLEKRVLIKNRHCCCICQRDGFGKEIVIHHIDGNNSNNVVSNLAVLCLTHASQADAGLKKGKLGSGRKLKPDQVKEYKRIWERKIELENKITKKALPEYRKKQVELLYNFEIHKTKNEILSLGDTDKRLKEKFEFLDQLVVEEFISGLRLRKILLEAYRDLAVQTIASTELPKRLATSVWGLFIHLIGPQVKPTNHDKKLFSESLSVLEILGEFAAEFNKKFSVLKKICGTLYDFYEIATWHKLKNEKTKIFKILTNIKKACLHFEKEKSTDKVIKERKERQRIVHKTLTDLTKLK